MGRPRIVAAAWLAAAALGVVGALHLAPLLTSGFTLPGTDSSRVGQLLATRFGDTSRGDFVVMAHDRRPLAAARRGGAEVARLLRGGRLVGVERLRTGAAAF